MHAGRVTAGSSLAVVLVLAGCTSFSGQSGQADPSGQGGGTGSDAARVATAQPRDPLTVVPDADPVVAAVGASHALFAHAEVAVLARAGDLPGTLLGASAAVGLGVPLLLRPADGGPVAGTVRAELDRLGTRTVLDVGSGGAGGSRAAGAGRAVVEVPARPDAVARVSGLRPAAADPVPAGGEVAAVAHLQPGAPVALRPAGAGTPPSGSVSGGRLPRVSRPARQDGVAVLATDGAESLAGVATARAAGARVQVLTGDPDPRSSPEAVAALADSRTSAVLTLGAAMGADPGLGYEVATARTGVRLPGGGQTLLPGHLLVALYGSPGSPALGVLGEQGIQPAIQRARDTAASFQGLVDVPVVPTLEIIVTVASSEPGPDGNYSTELDPETIRPWVEAARDAGLYVLLDLQPGRADFLSQAQRYRSLLELPGVGLALDPEWRLAPGQVPLAQIGSVGIDEVNAVGSWLADLTRADRLPQKLLVVHQFRLSSLPDRGRLDTSHPELAVVVHADGQGSQGDKQATWRALHGQDLPPGGVFWGWKNFYDEDHPVLTSQQTIEQVDPRPDLVTFQ